MVQRAGRVHRQLVEHRVLRSSQFHLLAGHRHREPGVVEAQAVHDVRTTRRLDREGLQPLTQRRPYAGRQFRLGEGLDEVADGPIARSLSYGIVLAAERTP